MNSVLDTKRTPADAAEMLSEMSAESYNALMAVIVRVYKSDEVAQAKRKERLEGKKKAFLRMEELRKDALKYYGSDFDAEKERAIALEEKYGRID